MNPEFKVLTNVNESNSRTPIIQNRFRKLTLQSTPKQNIQTELPEPLKLPTPNKLAIEKTVNPPVSPYKSQTETITNKLMLSTSSTNNTDQTNFINVETEPFTNPLRVESSENEKENLNNDLASQMERLDVSVDLFSQFTSSSSKFSLPPNRLLSNKENIDNISQRISNIRMSDNGDLADTQPNTSSHRVVESQKKHLLAETQPNSSPIVLSSDGEDDDGNNEMIESLLTEESEEDDDSVIELLSSSDSADERNPQNISAINTQAVEITESVAQKLDHFFDNIPNLTVSHKQYNKNEDSVCSEINISETEASESDNENPDENNILRLQTSQLDDKLGKSGELSSSYKSASQASNEKEESRSLGEAEDTSLHRSSVNESGKTSEPDEQSIQTESDNMASEPVRQSSDDKQVSVHGASKKIEFEKIKTSAKSVTTLNSPIINISAKVNINIQLTGFCSSTTTSDTDTTNETSENTDAASEESSKNNDTAPSETGVNTSEEFVARCRKEDNHTSGSNSKNVFKNFPNHKTSGDSGDSDEISPNSSVIESSLIHASGDDIEEKIQNNSGSLFSSVDGTEELIAADADKSTTKQDENSVSVSTIDASVEIDEIGEKILNDIYGDAWRTPQLIKKCMSTRKKCLTDVPKRCISRGFSLFQEDIPSVFESTRIASTAPQNDENICRELDQSEHSPVIPSNEAINGTSQDQSSRIIRSCRKVAVNRILDSSSDDDHQSVDSGSEESYSKCTTVDKPKPTQGKKNKFVFLDLTCHEAIEDEDHGDPDATAEELENVCEIYLQSLQAETVVQTPAPNKESTKHNASTTTTKRKLFTPNYDDQMPFEDVNTPVRLQSIKNDKVIQLKTPIPSYLIPPQFRAIQLIDTKEIQKPITPHAKKIQSPRTPASSRTCGFLESLDDKLIPVQHCHPDALRFRSKFKPNRVELVNRLMTLFNDQVFDGKLIDVPVSWGKKLTKTAGLCHCRKISGSVRKAQIELSEKVLTSAERLRDTIIHELCHAAVWIIDKDGSSVHGAVWKYWAQRANRRFPELPIIERCHNYDILHKYTYKCTICGLKSQSHSKSKKVENIRCAKCHGPIEVFLNKMEKDGTVTLMPPKEPSMFAKYVQENYKLSKQSGVSHAAVMKILSNNYAMLSVQEKIRYKN